jgi:hypothetical protein
MDAKTELIKIQDGLQKQMHDIQGELDAVKIAIGLLEKNRKESTNEMRNESGRFASIGLSEACRLIVGSEFISPGEVRNLLREGGFENKENLFNNVHATLTRLSKGDKAEFEKKLVDGRTKFRRKSI